MDDEELCNARGPDGLICGMPKNHDGTNHTFEIELPPHVAQMIAAYIDHLEVGTKEVDIQLRRMRRIRWFLYFAAALNVAAALYYLALILGQP